MRIEGDHHTFSATAFCQPSDARQQRLMTPVNTVKATNRDDGTAETGEIRKLVVGCHSLGQNIRGHFGKLSGGRKRGCKVGIMAMIFYLRALGARFPGLRRWLRQRLRPGLRRFDPFGIGSE